jgi:hypothetical protein
MMIPAPAAHRFALRSIRGMHLSSASSATSALLSGRLACPGQQPAKTPNSKSGDNLVSYQGPKINREKKCQSSGL